eukprot:48810-Eustigmatos_ZCMA.PRE.1
MRRTQIVRCSTIRQRTEISPPPRMQGSLHVKKVRQAASEIQPGTLQSFTSNCCGIGRIVRRNEQ